MELHIRLLSASDVPAMDLNGKSDPYVSMKMKGVKDSKQRSSTKKSTLSPEWNEEFHFTISDISTDILCLKLADWDMVKNDIIGTKEIPLRDFTLGLHELQIPLDPHNGKHSGGIVHVIIHLSSKGATPFVEEEWQFQWLNCLIIEADMGKPAIISPNLYAELELGEHKIKTESKTRTNTPQWMHFSSVIAKGETIKLSVLSSGVFLDTVLGRSTLSLSSLTPNFATKGTYDLRNDSGMSVGKISVVMLLSDDKVDHLEIPADIENIEPGDRTEVHVRVVRATNVWAHIEGSGIPCCKVSLFNQPKSQPIATRCIESTKNPYWNEILRFQVHSLNTDALRFEIVENRLHDRGLICGYTDIPLSECEFGVVHTRVVELTKVLRLNSSNRKSIMAAGPNYKPQMLEIEYQVTHSGQTPFVHDPYIPMCANVRLVSVGKLVDPISCQIRLENDAIWQKSSLRMGFWNEDFQFMIADQATDCVEIKTSTGVLFRLPVCGLNVSTQTLELASNDLTCTVLAQVAPRGAPMFSDLQQGPRCNQRATLYAKIIGARDIPLAGFRGYVDAACRIQWSDEKEYQSTDVVYNTCMPMWNEHFELPVRSLRTDVAVLTLFANNKASGECRFNINSLTYGIPEVREFVVGKGPTTITALLHLAGPDQIRYCRSEFTQKSLSISIVEAVFTKPISSFVQVKLSNDSDFLKTETCPKTEHPQWGTEFKLPVADIHSETLVLELIKDGLFNKRVGSLEINLLGLNEGDRWYEICDKDIKIGELRLVIALGDASPGETLYPEVDPSD